MSAIKGGRALVNSGSSAVSAVNLAKKTGNALARSGNVKNSLVKTEDVETGFKCREEFKIHEPHLNFYHGHMVKGLNKMQGMLSKVDCILEIHDARIPFSGRNPMFYQKLTAIRPHILVLNKSDLVDGTDHKETREILLRNEPHLADVIYANSKAEHCQSIKSLMPSIVEAIETRAIHTLKHERYFMVIGIPNTGKSSLINAMRRVFVKKGKACRVEAHACVTKTVQERVKLSDWPPTYCYDTPGISTPSIPDTETGMRLAAVGCLKDQSVGIENVVDYMLYYLNKRGMFEYVNAFGLDEPTDDVYVLLINIAKSLRLIKKTRVFTSGGGYKQRWDTLEAANHFVRNFRAGNFGLFMLDDDRLEEERAKHSDLRLDSGRRPLTIDSGRRPLAIDTA